MSIALINIDKRGFVEQPRDRGPRSISNQVIESWINKADSVIEAASRITFVDFDALRQRIRDTANLMPGWDSGSAGPMSGEAIEHALSLLNALESARIPPSRVIPTCDDSILVRYHIHNQTIEWEFFSEGDNVRVQIEPDGTKSYLEVNADQISDHI
jgi:hypothetical protein